MSGAVAKVGWEAVSVELGGRQVVAEVTLEVGAGEWLTLIGPNGAGKTTLLRTLVGSAPNRGRVSFDGQPLSELPSRTRARQVAYVTQHPVIPPGVRVFDYALLGRSPHQGLRFAPSRADQRHTLAVLQRLDLEQFADRRVDTLSGGERQRVVLARALVQDTGVLVLDEPTSFLDLGHQFEVLELIAAIREEQEMTVITTIHDLGVAGQFADRVAVLVGGRLVDDGLPVEVLTADFIERHWGVPVAVEALGGGGVSITPQRRRVRRVTPSAPSST
ncbi:MAG: ABC transporter ATP-binding protein [Actinomycetia bacterium]|nr:ABC transporter ATP-binding protein [Actinomycetes bacterium]